MVIECNASRKLLKFDDYSQASLEIVCSEPSQESSVVILDFLFVFFSRCILKCDWDE